MFVMKIFPDSTENLEAKIDRVVLSGATTIEAASKALSDFRITADHGRLNINEGFFLAPYGRFRRMTCDRSGTHLFVEYQPRFRRLAPVRVAIFPDDVTGLRRRELEAILSAFRPYRLRILEIAIDFPRSRGMSAQFIRRTVRCGKSRMRPNKNFPDAVWLGAPKSEKFLRSYPKPSIDGFRVEMQFNRGAIKKYGLNDPGNWVHLPEIVVRHIGFFRVAW